MLALMAEVKDLMVHHKCSNLATGPHISVTRSTTTVTHASLILMNYMNICVYVARVYD